MSAFNYESTVPPRGVPDIWTSGERFVQAWRWLDIAGHTLGFTVRFESDDGKKYVIPFFRCKDGSWSAGGPAEPKPLFALDAISSSSHRKRVYIVEGEKCASALHQLGLLATTSIGGARSCSSTDWSQIAHFEEIVILPDNDTSGREYANSVATICEALPGKRKILIADLPGLPEKGDVVDWLMQRASLWGGYGPILKDEPGLDFDDVLLNTIEQCATVFKPIRASKSTVPAQVMDAPTAQLFPDAQLPPLEQAAGMQLDELSATYCTDVASAYWMKSIFGEEVSHSSTHGWMLWEGKRWTPDVKGVRRLAQEVGARVCQIVRDSEFPTGHGFERLLKFARYMQTSRGIDAMLKEAECLEGIDATNVEFDADPMLLNCPNGTIDLRTGELLAHSRAHRISKMCTVPYEPGAKCPRFERFLCEIFQDRADLIEYMRWVLGYCITGATEHQIFFILHGNGANGKSTLLNVLQHVLGADYAQQMDSEALMHQHNPQHPAAIARLRGARLVVCMETASGRRLNEALLKSLSGGDKIVARRMRENPFEFKPQLKLFIGTNAPPVIADYSNGMWRRIRLIPFDASFEGEDRDNDLQANLLSEAPGILAMAVRAAQQAQSIEPALPESVKFASEEYRRDQDMLSQFIEECCGTENDDTLTAKGVFYKAYQLWRDSPTCESSRTIGQRMKALGFAEHRTGEIRYWRGIQIIQRFGISTQSVA